MIELVFRNGRLVNQYSLTGTETGIVQRAQTAIVPTIALPTSIDFRSQGKAGFLYASEENTNITINVSTSFATSFIFTPNILAEANVSFNVETNYASALTFDPSIFINALVNSSSSYASLENFIPNVVTQNSVSVETNYASSVTFFPQIAIAAYPEVLTSTATSVNYTTTILISKTVQVETLLTTAYSFEPIISIGTEISTSTSLATSLTYDPITRVHTTAQAGLTEAELLQFNPIVSISKSVPISTVIASGNIFTDFIICNKIEAATSLANCITYEPTLSLGSIIYVGASLASAKTYNPRFDGEGVLPDQLTSTAVIGVPPSIRKGILNISGQSIGIVLVGQIGLSAGDKLIYLGNGQWRKL